MWIRFRYMTGIDVRLAERAAAVFHLHLGPHAIVALTVAVLAVLTGGGLLALIVATGQLPAKLEWFAVGSTVLIVLMFLWPSQFHYHFPAFLAPFLALAAALPVSRLLALHAHRTAPAPGQASAPAEDWLAPAAVAVAVIVLVVFAATRVQVLNGVRAYLTPTGIAAAKKIIPAGSCVATDVQSALILSDRFYSNVPGCPLMVDGIGTDLALSAGLKPSTGAGEVPSVAALWRQEFTHAQFALLSGHDGRRIAWTPALRAYFTSNFTLVKSLPGAKIYQRHSAR